MSKIPAPAGESQRAAEDLAGAATELERLVGRFRWEASHVPESHAR